MVRHNGTSDALRTVLVNGGKYSIKDLTRAVATAGIPDASETNVRRIADQRRSVGEFLVEREAGTLVYSYNPNWISPRKGTPPRVADPARVEAAVQALGERPVDVPTSLAAGLGVAVGARRQIGGDVDAEVRALFEDRLSSDTLYTARDVAQELDGRWRTGEVAIALYEGVQQGWLHMEHSEEDGDNVFRWQAPGDTPAVTPPARAIAPFPAPTASTPSPATHVATALGFGDRLAGIVADLEDAIGEACDRAAPHSVIKALVLANGAAHRALRDLAA